MGGKGQGSNIQEGILYTYTLRLDYNKNSISYKKKKQKQTQKQKPIIKNVNWPLSQDPRYML